MVHLRTIFKKIDWTVLIIILILGCLGLAIQYSLGLSQQSQNIFYRQAIYLIISLALFFLVLNIDYRHLKNYSKILYLIMIGLLVLTLFFGKVQNNTRGWLSFGFFNLQVVEIAKVILIIVLANYWSAKNRYQVTFRHVIESGLIAGLPFALVMLQPDLGSGLILFGLWLGMLFFCDYKISHWLLVIVLIAILILVAWCGVLKDYQKDRLISFVNPQSDPLGRGYQLTQSMIAVGAGGLSGRGLGLGTQSQLKFLPASHTDFVFSVIAEDLGLVGAGLVLIIYFILFYKLFNLARSSYDDFSLLMLVAISLVFFVQIFINIGMNIGLMPITGVPLIFLSYGGSSLLSTFIIFGLIESLIIYRIKT
ncbi:MAG: rod shape-determining protein RodA [Patescibacteria group bacterium]|nr:rod shape-determining protein RodA [Patescibacteria group bacterium]